MTDQVTRPDELRDLVTRIERLKGEQSEIGEQIKEVYALAKGKGYDPAVIRKLIQERAKDPDDVDEFNAVLDVYRDAMK